jgi:hypothetical protein
VDVGLRRLRTEATILAELIRCDYAVLLPFGTNQRYDLVLDIEGEFVRAQCQTGRLKGGVVEYSTRSVRSNRKEILTPNYAGQVEIFLVHCPQTGGIYAVPVDEAPEGYGSLRVSPTRNVRNRRFAGLATTNCPPSSIGGALDL